MYRKEPFYALDDLKRTYYIMIAIIFNLSTLMADLSQEIKADQNTQLLWRQQAQKGREVVYKDYLQRLRITAAREIDTVDELYEKAEEINSALEEFLPLELRTALMKATQKDYCFYTSCGYGRFWNEVELPEIVEILFHRFCELVHIDKDGEYAVAVYDMSDREIVFSEEKQVDALMETYDLEPCEKMVKRDGAWFCY